MTAREYNTKVDALCPEKVFRLLTNPNYFPSLPWLEQRSLVFEMAGDISDTDIASTNKAFKELLTSIQGKKSIEEYNKEIGTEKRKIKEELVKIPPRIDENVRLMPQAEDWDQLTKDLAEQELHLTEINAKILDAGKGIEEANKGRNELQNQISLHKNSKQKIDQEVTRHIEDLKFEHERKLRLKKNEIIGYNETIEQNKTRITGLVESNRQLLIKRTKCREEWHSINNEQMQFNEEQNCPTCGQLLPDEMVNNYKTEAVNKFNVNKAERLEQNVKEGKSLTAQIKENEFKIETCNQTIKETEEKIQAMQGEQMGPEPDYEAERIKFLETRKYNSLVTLINRLEKELEGTTEVKAPDTSALVAERQVTQNIIDGMKKKLNTKEQIESGKKRIEELKAQEKQLSQKLADLEKIEYTILQFNKAKTEIVEARINGMFSIVRFKMFRQQVNGGEEPTCELMVDGVPYSAGLNSAGKIQAGLDVIKTLSAYYMVYPPVFVDNRESVTDIPKMDSQVINLFVSPEHKELLVA